MNPDAIAFEALHPKLRSLLAELDFDEATAAQKEAIPAIDSGDHVLLIAPTGYGKTEAALLPVFDEFLRARDAYRDQGKDLPAGFKILYVTPLRALNRDMLRRVERWGKTLDVAVGVRHSDTTQAERRKQATNPPDLLITTPETVQLLFTGHRLRGALETVRWLVVDEIHELAASERGYQFAVAMERIEEVLREAREEDPPSAATPSGFQRVGLSATVGNPHTIARLLGGPSRPVRIVQVQVDKRIDIRVEHPRPTSDDRVTAARVSATSEQTALLRRTAELIRDHHATLVFSNTRDGAELLGSRLHLYDPDLPVSVHHGSLSREARLEAEEAYKDAALKALICTSSLELGIDVGRTDLVIQNGSPRGVERMVQRVGRAGHRTGETSHGVVLATSGEDAAEAAVIARRAMGKRLEPVQLRDNPLGVLANQLLHMAVEHQEVPIDHAHRILNRTAPFAGLTRDLLDRTVRQLETQGLLFPDWDRRVYSGRATSRRYMIDNVGMIPDEKTFRVVETTRRAVVGTLDEDFVLSYIEPGARFIMRGRTWDVLEMQDDAVLVAEGEALGAIPSWQGQDLPVPWSVAQEVGAMRRAIAEGRRDRMADEYPLDPDALDAFEREVRRNTDKGLALADDQTLVLEAGDRIVILNACFGTRANQTLGRLLEALVAQRLGQGVQLTTDSYRIILESSRGGLRAGIVEETLRELDPETLEELLRVIIRNSNFLRYHLLHVARKFGAVARDLDPHRFSMRRFLESYRDMPLFDEAIERVLFETMDVDHLRKALGALADGRLTIVNQKLSAVGRLGIEKERRMLSPSEEEPSILRALKERLGQAKRVLVCVACGRTRTTTVDRTPKRPECASCGAIMLAPLHPNERGVAGLIKKKQRTEDEQKRVQRAVAAANLVAIYGRDAVLAMAGRGVGPDTAARILRKQHDEEAGLLRDILAAEVQYAKTRRFWD